MGRRARNARRRRRGVGSPRRCLRISSLGEGETTWGASREEGGGTNDDGKETTKGAFVYARSERARLNARAPR